MVCDRKMWGRWFASNCDVCFHLGCLSSQACEMQLLWLHGNQCWEKRSLYRAQGRVWTRDLAHCHSDGVERRWHSRRSRGLPTNQIIWFSWSACPSLLLLHEVRVSFRQRMLSGCLQLKRIWSIAGICYEERGRIRNSMYFLWRKS